MFVLFYESSIKNSLLNLFVGLMEFA